MNERPCDGKRCRAERGIIMLIFIRDVNTGRYMPVEAGTGDAPGGNIAVWAVNGQLLCRVLGRGAVPLPHEQRWLPHWPGCPDSPQFRGPAGWIRRSRKHEWQYRARPGADPAAVIRDRDVAEHGKPAAVARAQRQLTESGHDLILPPLPAEPQEVLF